MDRTECMHLLEKKPTYSQLTKVIEQVDTKFEELLENLKEKTSKYQK